MIGQLRSRWLGVLVFLNFWEFALVREAAAQSQFLANPTDVTHPWISELNPAVIPFQNSQLALGLKILHWGFVEHQLLGLRENGFNISFPFLLPHQVGFGFDIRQFYASVYSEIAVSALVSKEVYDRFAIGIKFGLEQRSLDRSKFHLVDSQDPLLRSELLDQYKLNAGAGLYWNPDKVTVGMAVNHLNRANVARAGKFLLPREISGAVSYRAGSLVPSLLLHHDGARWNTGFALAAVKPKLGTLRLGYESTLPIKVEAEFHLDKNSKLNYAYDFATEGTRVASSGSHQMTYSYIFGREPEIGEPVLFSSTNALNILIETITRSTTPKLTPEALASLSDLTPDYLVPMATSPRGSIIITAGKLGEGESAGGTINRYRELGAEMEKFLRENPGSAIALRTKTEDRRDAAALKQFLTERLHLSEDQITLDNFHPAGRLALEDFKPGYKTIVRKEPKFSSERVVFDLKVPGRTRRTQKWLFTITDAAGRTVRSFSGKGNLPGALEWDWRNAKGAVVSPGVYQCTLRIHTKSGKLKTAAPISLAVYQTRRTINLKFYGKPRPSSIASTNDNPEKQASNQHNVVQR
ncbi:MAG: type IX secretion system membrane protein PorP/SprF [candidate division KSB1 bacterium]|nr:type IX secretion system membrane protein PorP/SprF [candidate division KSB1 bacterium]MDZ7303055.1 type IX secretion system membrane protein PorP/SprF [candidate division KSB1 bacterium]MDZ7312437.1 type IX secretion system membrane protein PorP/SprF [candidate division KSB1 bacterium]